MPLLEITDLRKSYRLPDGREDVVVDIPAFAMEDGEQVALAGGSGSGKTTLLNLVAGILRPDSGRIVLDGTDVTSLGEGGRDRLRARTIGYMFQTFNLLEGFSALENVVLGMTFGPGPDAAAAEALLRELDLGDRLDHRPSQLSVGQQARVALARALAGGPRLVLADEPTGNLDARRAADAMERIHRTCREHDAALLLVSHDPAVLETFDRVERLEDLNRAAVRPEEVA